MFEEAWKPWPVGLVYGAVFYVCSFAALKYIRQDKQPMKLGSLKIVYNAIMSIFSFYVFWGVLVQFLANYNGVVPSAVHPVLCDSQLQLVQGMEWYFRIFYWSKFVEFADTYFLVMGGQAGFSMKMGLHLYHHFVTPTICFVTWFYPCTGGWIGPLTNAFVHVVMYAYYGLSVVWPGIKRYGNYVTYIQLTQFISVLLYLAVLIFFSFGCENCHQWQLYFNFAQYMAFLLLFIFFFLVKNRPKTAETSNGKAASKRE